MFSLLTILGLRQPPSGSAPPSIAGAAIIWQFLIAYGVLSSRTLKQYYGIDHNVSPREDLAKYGNAAVTSGKITQKQLNQLKRLESAHANSVEQFPLFVGALIWAHLARLSVVDINRNAVAYVLLRIAYAKIYTLVDRPVLSQLRGLTWWASNLVCLRLFWLGGVSIDRSQ